jgi:hypothetical protein
MHILSGIGTHSPRIQAAKTDAIDCGVTMIGAGLVTLSNLLSTVVEVWPSRTLLRITIHIQNKLILSLFFSAFNVAIIDATDHNVNIHLFINVNVNVFYFLFLQFSEPVRFPKHTLYFYT